MDISDLRKGRFQDLPADKKEVRTQFGALCFRMRADEAEILLVTSRETQRWVVPKGWPMPGLSPVDAARLEAWEEAGARGKMGGQCHGIYSYFKVVGEGGMPCVVALFPLHVTHLAKTYPESKERRRKWFSLKKAATKVDEPELAELLQEFNPATYQS
jgi:8-oxo-dGTP pyrophosphatase MutT (NUDIX family)